MQRIFVCSPFRGNTQANLVIARALGRYVFLELKAIPVVPHTSFTSMLDDNIELERNLGISAGHNLMETCHQFLLYSQKGISSGMREDIKWAEGMKLDITWKNNLLKVLDTPVKDLEIDEPTCVVCLKLFRDSAFEYLQTYGRDSRKDPKVNWGRLLDKFKEQHHECLTREVDLR